MMDATTGGGKVRGFFLYKHQLFSESQKISPKIRVFFPGCFLEFSQVHANLFGNCF